MATVTIIGAEGVELLPKTTTGAPLVYPFTFHHPSLPTGKLTLPGAPIVRPALRKRVVETQVVDGSSVIELIGQDTTKVDIRVIDDAPRSADNAYVVAEHEPNKTLLASLVLLFGINDSIEVDNEYLAQMGVTHLVIEEMEPEVSPGRPRVIMNLRCRADNPYNQLTD